MAPHSTQLNSFPGDSAWLRGAVADEADARWEAGLIALASAVEAATEAHADPSAAPVMGARLAALYDAVHGHLVDLDDMADAWAGWPEYRAYLVDLREFRSALQAWRFSRGEGRPRDGRPPLPGPDEQPMANFGNAAWRLVGDAVLLQDTYAAAVQEAEAEPARPWWRRWFSR